MPRYFSSLLICFLIATNVMAQASPPADERSELQRWIERAVVTHQQKQAIPGVAVAVYYRGDDYYFNYGFADKSLRKPVSEKTIFELASITKIFTTTMLAMEVQTGRMHLDDPVVKYLPGLSQNRNIPINKVTLVTLATHTSGFPRDVEGFGIEKGSDKSLMSALKKWRSKQRIGSHYLYSNVGFGLLGKALEGAEQKSYQALLSNEITLPLAMSQTWVQVPGNQAQLQAQGYRASGKVSPGYVPLNLIGGGALRSSSSDLLKFLKAYLGVPDSAISQNLALAMRLAVRPFYDVNSRMVMALGWQRVTRHGKTYITKNGMNQGFNTFIGFNQKNRFGVVVLTNKRDGMASKLGAAILDHLASGNQKVVPD